MHTLLTCTVGRPSLPQGFVNAEERFFFFQGKHADSIKELAAAASQNESIHSQLAESQKQQWKLTASQQEAEAAREVAEAAQEAAEAELAEATHSIAVLQEQLASQHTQMDRLQACTSLMTDTFDRKAGAALQFSSGVVP